MQMQAKQTEDATWGDMDWGSLDPAPAVSIVEPMAAPVVTSPPVRVDEPAAIEQPSARHAEEAALERQRHELERLRREVEQARQEAARPASPKSQPPEVKTKAAEGEAVVFTPASNASLTLRSEDGNEVVITVKGKFTVGRHKNNDLVIKDLHVSNHHARLVCGANGVFEVEDLNSSGGTFVNGLRVQRQTLATGDDIEFANVSALFRYVAGAQFFSEQEFAGTLVEGRAAVARKLIEFNAAGRQGRLTVTMPDGTQSVWPVQRDLVIGRLEDNDVVIANKHVSGRHARLLCSRGGLFEIMDMKSTCGTQVNDAAVQSHTLANGDRIRLGTVECVFEIIDSAASASPIEASPVSDRRMPFPLPKPAAAPAKPLDILKRPDQ